MIQFDGCWPKKETKTFIWWEMSTFQHFSNTVIFKKSPNSCSQPAFLASSIRHKAKTQQKESLLTVYIHHVYNACTLFLLDSSRGCTTSSAFHFHRFSKGWGIPGWLWAKATINQPWQEVPFSALLPHDSILGSIMFSFSVHHWALQGPFFGIMVSRNV